MTTANKIIVAVLISTAVGTAAYAIYRNPAEVANGPVEEGTACTMEARQCSDGSYVGRMGPKCEFAACPGSEENQMPSLDQIKETTVVAKIGEVKQLLGATVVVTEVVEDSRCPVNVNCIWAGTVRVKVRATYGLFSKTLTLTLGEPYVLNGHSVTLTSVDPQKTTADIATADYRYTFFIK